MKSGSTNDITEYILYNAAHAGERSKPVAILKYLQGSSFIKLDDVKSLNASISNTNKQHGKFVIVPPSNTLGASIDNRRSKYSPGTGGDFDGILIRNRVIKAFVGYDVGEGATQTNGHNVNNYDILYHAKIVGSKIYNDIISASGFTALPGITESWLFYDGPEYGDGTYSPEGYYLSDIKEYNISDKILELQIDSDSALIDVYLRTSDVKADLENNTRPFTLLGQTVNGTQTFSIDEYHDKYLQFALVFRTGAWGTGYVENINIKQEARAELFALGEYLIDVPSFNAASGKYSASINARDIFKKAYETKVSTPAYTGADVAAIMRDICDRANIPHNDGSELIPNTGYTVTIAAADTFEDEKAIDALNECMLYLNFKDSSYKLELIDDRNLQLIQRVESQVNVDWQIDYRFNMLSISKAYESDKLLNRITVLAKEHPVDAEVQLATDTKTSAGTYDLAWSGEAIYKRITISGDGTFVLNYVENEKINYTLSGGTINKVITIDGNKLQSSSPFAGEDIYFENHEEKEGFTKKIINRLIQSDTEAKEYCQALVSLWGDPEFKTSVKIPCNPLLVVGDFVLLWEKFTNTNTIYRIDRISIAFNAKGASLYQTLQLSDTGIEYTNIVWDRHNAINGGMRTGIDDRQWDKGGIWDHDLGPLITEDTNSYDNLKKVRVG